MFKYKTASASKKKKSIHANQNKYHNAMPRHTCAVKLNSLLIVCFNMHYCNVTQKGAKVTHGSGT